MKKIWTEELLPMACNRIRRKNNFAFIAGKDLRRKLDGFCGLENVSFTSSTIGNDMLGCLKEEK